MVDARNFQLVPELSKFGTGVLTGQRIRNNYMANQENANQIERQNQFRLLTGQAMDTSLPMEQRQMAMQQRAAIDPAQHEKMVQSRLQTLTDSQKYNLNSAAIAASQITQLPPERWLDAALQRRQKLIAEGRDTSETDSFIQTVQSGDFQTAQKQLETAISLGKYTGAFSSDKGVQFGAQETFKDDFDNFYFGTTVKDPSNGQVSTVLTPIGDSPDKPLSKVSMVSSSGLRPDEQVKQKAEEEAAKEAAKLKTQMKLRPEVEAAVAKSLADVRAQEAMKDTERSDDKAFKLYSTAMGSLADSLSGTSTGFFVGWIPSITANQQIADGAVAAMAPIMKQMFRAAGEGTFTDSDQKLLMAMIPTRSDTEEARISKLKNIDAIVRAKLGQPAAGKPGNSNKVGRFNVEVEE